VRSAKAHALHYDQMVVDLLHSDPTTTIVPPSELLSSSDLEDFFVFKGFEPLLLLMSLTIDSC
jgi:hypothetical protein